MNAKDFVSLSDYEFLVDAISNGKDERFEKKVTCPNGWYEITVNTQHSHDVLNEWGWATGMIDYKYRCDEMYDGYCRGGGTLYLYSKDDKDYSSFCNTLNDQLRCFPDFKEDEYEQISLF